MIGTGIAVYHSTGVIYLLMIPKVDLTSPAVV